MHLCPKVVVHPEIPATLVVGFTTGGPIFEVFQVLAEDFKIVRFSLVLFVRLLCQ
jgi:hypothetical protein